MVKAHRGISVPIMIRSSRRTAGGRICGFSRSTKSRRCRICRCHTRSLAAPRCSSTSLVVRDRPTPHRRACQPCGTKPSLTGPRPNGHHGRRWGLPVLARGVSIHAWGLRLRRARAKLALALRAVVAFRLAERHRARSGLFRRSIPGLHVPASTPRWLLHDRPRMTRGQDGSLGLSCVTLPFTTRRRFIPAHSASC
jgi:hypothetical protein